MQKSQVTADHVEYWRAVNRTFRGYERKYTAEETRREIGRAIDGRPGGAQPLFHTSRDFNQLRDWAFRILEGLSDGHVQAPKRLRAPAEDWAELEREVRAHVQAAFLQQRAECTATATDEEWPNPWDDEEHFVRAVRFFLKNMSPFHIWAVMHRVQETCHERVLEDSLEWTSGGSCDMAAVACLAFDNAIRGIDTWVDAEAEGVSLSSPTP